MQPWSEHIHVQNTTSQLCATFNNYFKLITDVHSYNTRQVKTRKFALPKHVQTQVLKW